MTSMPGCGWVWDECIRNTRRRFQEVEAARTGLICLDPARFCARTRVLQHITPTARARAHTRTQIPHTRWKEWASHGAHNNARGGLWKGAADKRGPLPLGVRSTSLHRHFFFITARIASLFFRALRFRLYAPIAPIAIPQVMSTAKPRFRQSKALAAATRSDSDPLRLICST
jgi:hypothetical protein